MFGYYTGNKQAGRASGVALHVDHQPRTRALFTDDGCAALRLPPRTAEEMAVLL